MSPFVRPSLSADDCADILRAHEQKIREALWALDSARSMLRKAQAGYRNSEAIGDGVWDLDTYGRRVEAATVGAASLINELRLSLATVEVTPFTRLTDQAQAAVNLDDGKVHRLT